MFAQVLAALDESKKVTYIKRDMSLAEAIANLRLILRQQQTVTFRNCWSVKTAFSLSIPSWLSWN